MAQAGQNDEAAAPEDAGSESRSARGGIVLTVVMLGFTGWYFLDAASRSTRVENLIMIVPMSIAAAVVGGVLLSTLILGLRRAAREAPASSPAGEPVDRRITAVAGLLCLYLLGMEPLGLDASTALFLCACFAVLGVRGWFGLVVAPVAVAVGVVWAMKSAFYIHIPTLLDGTS